MARIIVVGGGITGLCAAMLLARDGHGVELLERDPALPPPPGLAWGGWERRGVNQFRMIHYLLPRFRALADVELPDVIAALEDAGGLCRNALAGFPPTVSAGRRDGDDRFDTITGRRPIVEAVIARVAAQVDGLAVRRGVAVRGLLAGEPMVPGVPHVVGVVADDGTDHRADLVVDASGRRSPLPGWLQDIGAPAHHEEVEDCGFIYYARHFRSADGSVHWPSAPCCSRTTPCRSSRFPPTTGRGGSE